MNRMEFYNRIRKYEENSLQHSSPLKGEQRQNAKYYKREGEPGNYTYYYSKAQWDAAQEAKKRTAYEVTKNIKPLKNEDIIKIYAQEAAEKKVNQIKKDLNDKQQKENYEKNKAAAEAGESEYKKQQDDAYKKSMYEGLVEKAKKHNQQISNFEKNKAAAEAQEAEYKKKQDDAYRKSMYEGLVEKARKHNKEIERKENYEKNVNSREEAMKKGQESLRNEIKKTEAEEYKKFTNETSKEIKNQSENVYKALSDSFDKKDTDALEKLKEENNDMMKLLENKLKDINLDNYDGDLIEYLDDGIWKKDSSKKNASTVQYIQAQNRLKVIIGTLHDLALELDSYAKDQNNFTSEEIREGNVFKALNKREKNKPNNVVKMFANSVDDTVKKFNKATDLMKDVKDAVNKVKIFK